MLPVAESVMFFTAATAPPTRMFPAVAVSVTDVFAPCELIGPDTVRSGALNDTSPLSVVADSTIRLEVDSKTSFPSSVRSSATA